MRCFVVLLCAVLFGCGANLATGYRAVAVVGQVRDQVSDALSKACEPKLAQCATEHGDGSEEYAECIQTCAKVGFGWTHIVLPAVNSSMAATLLALDAARAKKEKNVSWWEKLRPGLCRMLDAVQDWKGLIGNQKAIDMIAKVQVISLLVCP